MNGAVKKKTRELKCSFLKSLKNEWKSLLPWETPLSKIGNTVNDLPFTLRKLISLFENMNLLNPNQVRLEKKNDRSPMKSYGTMMLTKIQKIF